MLDAIAEAISSDPDNLVVFAALGVGGIIATIAIVSGTIYETLKRRGRERTVREISAYIAEGSVSPEQGERLIQAATRGDDD